METMNNKEQAQTAQQQAAQPSEPMRVKVLRITAIKGYLNKTVDLPVDEDGIKMAPSHLRNGQVDDKRGGQRKEHAEGALFPAPGRQDFLRQ